MIAWERRKDRSKNTSLKRAEDRNHRGLALSPVGLEYTDYGKSEAVKRRTRKGHSEVSMKSAVGIYGSGSNGEAQTQMDYSEIPHTTRLVFS